MVDPTERGPIAAHAARSGPSALLELALLFGRLGTTAFGGPAVHIAMMEDEVVRRRQWLTREEFLDLLGATNLIPGPNSTEMAIHIGHRRAGVPGLLVAGTSFILPAVAIVGALAWAYVRFGRLPAAEALLRGVKPVVVAVVAQALVGFGRTALRSRLHWAVAAGAAAAASLGGVNELLVLVLAGAVVLLSRAGTSSLARMGALLPFVASGTAPGMVAGVAASPFSVSQLFFLFLKIGSVLYGSGYVLLAFLRADLVERLGWLSESQLLDAVAIGQVTPGPVFTTATFIGYVLGGAAGGAAATIGIFLPAFVFVAASGPLVSRVRRSITAGAFLDGVNVASLALMAVVSTQLARAAVVDLPTALLAIASMLLLVRWRVNSSWLVLGGAAAGLLFFG
jgi:chromate transporter